MSGLGLFYLADSYADPGPPPPSGNSPGITNQYMQGICWRETWERLDPNGTGPDFDWLNDGVTASENAGKLSALTLLGGRFSPSWVFATPNIQILSLVEQGDTTVVWDPIWQGLWQTANEALAAEFDGRSAYIDMSGIGHGSESFLVPGFPDGTAKHQQDMDAADALAVLAGYADAFEAWQAGVAWLMSMMNSVWPNTPFNLITGTPLPINFGGPTALQNMYDLGDAAYNGSGGRFGAEAHDLEWNSPTDGQPSATIIQQLSPRCISTGYEFGDSQNDPGLLNLSLQRGINYGAHQIRLFPSDANDPASASVLSAAANQLLGNAAPIVDDTTTITVAESFNEGIGLALSDAFSVVGTTFGWNGQRFGCVLNADQNVLVTSKLLFGTNLPRIGDVINLAGKDRQITGRANSAEEFVPGGLSAENTFVNDPANPSLAIQFSSFIGK